MTKKQTELSEELREAVFEAARAGAAEAYTQNTGYVNYFKAMERRLLGLYRRAGFYSERNGAGRACNAVVRQIRAGIEQRY